MPKLWFRAETERSRLLPPVCPSCLAVGVRPLEVPQLRGATGPSITTYYCDRCADRLERASTLSVAKLASAGLLGVGTATSAALALGGAHLVLQLLLSILAALAPLGIFALLGPPAVRPALFQLPGSSTTNAWLAARQDYLETLDVAATRTRLTAPRRVGELAPLVVTIAWLAGLHWLGRAELRVIHGSHTDAVVLVDQRRREVVPPTHVEHPHAARPISTLAGRRSLALVTDAGEPVVDVIETLWPGRDYVLGTLPRGQCLFLERQEYGAEGAAHALTALPGDGPLWELPVSIDVWFMALRERPSLPTSGGVRIAVRLLPCRK